MGWRAFVPSDFMAKSAIVLCLIILAAGAAAWIMAQFMDDDLFIDCVDCDQAYQGVSKCPVHAGHDVQHFMACRDDCISSAGPAVCYSVRCQLSVQCKGPAWHVDKRVADAAVHQALHGGVFGAGWQRGGAIHPPPPPRQ